MKRKGAPKAGARRIKGRADAPTGRQRPKTGGTGAGARGEPKAAGGRGRHVTVQLDELRARLAEAESTLSAIRGGEVDALVIGGTAGEQVYTLQGAETPYRVLVEQMQEGAVTLNEDGTILYGNQCFADLVGAPLERALGTPLRDFIHPGDAPGLVEFLGASRTRTARREVALRRPDGTIVDALLTAGALEGDEAGRICLVVTDLTEHKRSSRLLAERTAELERSNEALRLAERLAAVGTLAAGLGHDISNMLLPIRMRLDALDAGSLPPELRADVAAIRKCAEHLQRLVAGVRLLSLDPDAAAPAEGTSLHECWPDIEAIIRTVLPAHVELLPDFAPQLPPLSISRQSLTQMIFNLVHNAADALASTPEGRVRVAAATDDDGMVRVSVADNGPGMTEEVRRRCLEPFFTTKVRRFNTGLGLALVHSVASRAGGRLEIDSRPGRGCTITLVLPGGPGASADPAGRRFAAVDVPDPRLRAFGASCLHSLGMIVTDNGPDAAPLSLWVAAASPGNLQRARCIVEADVDCRVLLVDATSKPAHPRIVPVTPGTPLAKIRALIENAVGGGDTSARGNGY